jgi:hypothetical protein
MGQSDSKLQFRRTVLQLIEQQQGKLTDATDADLSLLWQLPDSVEDVCQLLSSADIRQLSDQTVEKVILSVSHNVLYLSVYMGYMYICLFFPVYSLLTILS